MQNQARGASSRLHLCTWCILRQQPCLILKACRRMLVIQKSSRNCRWKISKKYIDRIILEFMLTLTHFSVVSFQVLYVIQFSYRYAVWSLNSLASSHSCTPVCCSLILPHSRICDLGVAFYLPLIELAFIY